MKYGLDKVTKEDEHEWMNGQGLDIVVWWNPELEKYATTIKFSGWYESQLSLYYAETTGEIETKISSKIMSGFNKSWG